MAQETRARAPDIAERLLPAVRKFMKVQDVVVGGAEHQFAVRFRGMLYSESSETYDRLKPVFEREGVTLLFRMEGNEHIVMAVPGVIQPKPSNPWINLVLFLLTMFSVIFVGVGTAASYNTFAVEDISSQGIDLVRDLPLGILFAGSILAILVAHEFGHYTAARYHNVAVSLPYFLPLPIGYIGTLGAAIKLKEPPRNRRVMLDIGISGPLAGLAVAIPILLIGLSLSKIGTLPLSPAESVGHLLEGNSLLYLGAKFLIKGEMLPSPVDYGGMHPLIYWGRYFFLGLPVPYGGRDVLMHPMAWAGWVGLLVTAVNLIPAGQLDGGHIIYVLFGRRAARLWPFIIVGLVILRWYLWAVLIFLLGRTYAQPLDEITQLDDRRKVLAIIGLIVLLLVFAPVPLMPM
jgi:Zn-dependent protease